MFRNLIYLLTFFFFIANSDVTGQTVSVTYPEGGEVFDINDGTYIEWTSSGIQNVKIEYSVNGGSSWSLIAASVNASNQYYYWIIPSNPSTDCFVKVSDASNASIFDLSDNAFTINPPSITVNYPNGGEIWGVGSYQYIYWDAPGVPTIDIEYSTDNGTTWKPILDNTPSAIGYYTWQIPNDISTEALVKITDSSNPSLFDISDNTFTIPAPYLDLTDPDGGENWGFATNQYIYWDSESIQNVKLEYSTDSGSTWNLIIASTPAASQYYTWTIPNTPSVKCLVRAINADNPLMGDTSLAVFTITGPTISLYDPNGFEIWNAGTNHYIDWTSNGVTEVNIEYSIDNGSTWINIVSNHPDNGYYYWTVPHTYSNQCRVKISSSTDSNLFDISDNVFTIPSPFIEVDQPNGGEEWSAGTNKYIYWTSNSIAQVDIHYSIDNGATWLLIVDSVNAPQGYYYWTIPFTYSTECLVKISETGNASLADVSDAVFTIPAPSIEVTTPNGGEVWSAFTNHYIYWDAPSVSSVKIEYSADNGSSWNLIASNINGALGYYQWNVPLTPSTNCLVRVTDMASNLVYDVSNAVFTIPMPSLQITDPNGGEVWSVGSSHYITWSSQSVSDVKIEYSTNNGTSWNLVENSTQGSLGYYYWMIPNTPSTTCLVRLTDNLNSQITSQSAAVFEIPQPAIAVTVPNGGEQWGGGSSHYIQWVSPSVQNVKIEYSLNNGSSWTTIISSTPAANESYQWTVPSTPSTQCKIRVSDASNSVLSDESDSLFVIPQPSVTVVSPNGGEVWSINTSKTITWSSNTVSDVKIEYTNNNGVSWNTIVSTTNALNGYYYWSIPPAAVGTCKIRITAIGNPSVTDISDSTFTIAGPSITLTSPVGGESWISGTPYYITWSSNGILNVKLEYTDDNEATWKSIHPSLNNYNYYYWNIPSNINSSTCKVRVSSVLNSSLSSKSNSVFSISPTVPSVSVTTPNGGEIFYTGNSYYINWNTTGVNNVKIEYSVDGGSSWLPVALSIPASNSFYYWNVPVSPSNNAKIRVSDAVNSSVSDVSDAPFTISVSTPSITVTSPNGGESWYGGSYHNITWNSNNIPSVDVSFSSDNGNTWAVIASNVTDNFIYWYVPVTASPSCLIKVEASTTPNLNDQSDAVFAIILPPVNTNAITTDSISPSLFCKLDTIKVYYTATGVYNSPNIFTVQLSDSLGSFTYPKIIGSSASTTSGYVTCVVPAYISNGTQFKVRVVSDDLPAVGSTAPGTITLESPVFNFTANDVNKYLPDGLVTFTYSGAASQTYMWDFGDGSISALQSPTHNYNNIGYKTVSLTASNSSGCALTVTKPFYIRVERLLPNTDLNPNTNSDISGISFINDTVGCIATVDGNLIVTYNGGQSFTSHPTGITGLTSALWIEGNGIYVTGPNGAILKSLNDGQSWNSMTTGTTETINGIAVQKSNGKGYAVGSNGKIMSFSGTTWSSITSGTAQNLRSVSSFGTGKAVIAGDNGSILRTTDYGTSWSSLTAGVTNNLRQVTFADSLTGYISAENGIVLISTDGGETWSVSLTGVDVSFTGIAVSSTGDTAWAVSNSGVVYRTTNQGQTWGRYSKGSTNDNTNATYRTSRGYITGKGGDLKMYDSDMDSTAIGIRSIALENRILLYPNPASETITIEFDKNSNDNVDINIYDLTGKMVKAITLAESSGYFRKVISIGDLNPGIYFIHLETGSESIVSRFVVTR